MAFPSPPSAPMVTAWLQQAGHQLLPKFPAEMEAFYTAETQAERERDQFQVTMFGAASGLLLLPLLWPLAPDAHGVILRVWCGVAIPAGLITGWLYRLRRLPLRVKEWTNTAASLVVAVCFSIIMAASPQAPPGVYAGGMMLLLLLHGRVPRSTVTRHVVQSTGILAIYTAAILLDPQLGGTAGWLMLTQIFVNGVLIVTGTWRLETELRRSYAMALRDRLAAGALSLENASLGQMAVRDALTGLANRRAYDAWLAMAWQDAERCRQKLALIILDIDLFKQYNDTYGHLAGDACLQQLAATLRDLSRASTDRLARIGGEEFALILEGPNADGLASICEDLRAGISRLQMRHDASPFGVVTISLGAATLDPADHAGPQALVAVADAALYAAKRAGRNRVHFGVPAAVPATVG